MAYKVRIGHANMSGSLGTDDIVYSEDSDTGIDFEADTIKLETGGAERLVVTNNGVGIGTDNPNFALHVAGEIGVDQYIRHNGDPNTHINFTNDKIVIKAGNKAMITMEEKDSAPHEVTINDGGNNIDFVVENNSGNTMFKTDASTSNVGIGTDQPEAALDINSNAMRLRNSSTPSSAGDYGFPGEIRWDSNYIYVCVATDTWKRVALSSW